MLQNRHNTHGDRMKSLLSFNALCIPFIILTNLFPIRPNPSFKELNVYLYNPKPI